MRKRAFVKVATSGLLLASSHAVFAQVNDTASARPEAQQNSGGLNDIVVTATRRETNVQDTPMAISAISGEGLRDSGISDPRQLSSLAPSLQVDQGLTNGQTHVSIRGIASSDFSIGSNSPVALNIDDVYQPFQFGVSSQVFDLNRVEVLRGPQGTLFGKNTTSGALNYYSQVPVFKEEGYFNVEGGGGDFSKYSVEGAFNKPISDTLAMRASLRVDRRDAYIDNLFDGTKLGEYTTYNGRLQFAWNPSAETRINLKLFGLKSRGDGAVYASFYLDNPCTRPGFFPAAYLCLNGVTAEPDAVSSRKVYSDVPTAENFDNYGATLKIEQDVGESTITSISAVQRGHYYSNTNDDGLATDAFHSLQRSKTEQASQELRFATPAQAPLRAVIGAFGQIDKIYAVQGSVSSQLVPSNFYDYFTGSTARQTSKSAAAFGSLTYDVNDRISFVGGLRYSYERKKIAVQFLNVDGFTTGIDFQVDDNDFEIVQERYNLPLTVAFSDAHSWKRLTWDITGNFKPSDDSLIYGRVASGFRSGGYQVGLSTAAGYNPAKPYIDPEKVMAYEVGFKSEWFDKTLRINGAAYLSDYKDMQVQLTNTSGTGSRLTNAATARVKGAELEIELAPAEGLHFNGSVGYNDAKFRRYVTIDPNRPRGGNASGNNLPYAPEWTGNLGATYDIAVDDAHTVSLNTNWTYRSRVYFDPFQENLSSDKPRAIGNLRISYGTTDKGWRLAAFVNNVTNQDSKVFVFPFGGQRTSNSFLFAPTIYAPKRTWGVQAAFTF